MKVKLIDDLDNFLQSPKGITKSWSRSLFLMILLIVGFSVILGLSYSYGPLGSQSYSSTSYLISAFAQPENVSFINDATYISIAGMSILGFPFLCLLAIWIIGINQTTSSKYYHLFLYLIIGVVFLLLIIAIVFTIRASITIIS